MSQLVNNTNALLKPYKGGYQKNKDSKSSSMIESPGATNVDISLANSLRDKTSANNKSVAITSVDMSKILP